MTVTVACCFADGNLPSSWFRLYQRLKLAVTRADLDAEVRLVALPLLTDHAVVVVVPPGLEAEASAGRAVGRRVIGLAERDSEGIRSLVAILRSMGAGPAARGTPLAHHRGFRLVANRVAGGKPAGSG